MSAQVHRTHLAERDLTAQARYLGEQNPRLAVRLLDAAEKTFKLLARLPGMGAPVRVTAPQLFGMRVWKIRGFKNHLVLYRPVDDGVEIVRVLHAAQDIEGILDER